MPRWGGVTPVARPAALASALSASTVLLLVLRVVQGARMGYDLQVVDDAGRHLLHGQPVYSDPLFLYLPSSALLAAPFALLSSGAAHALGAALAGLAVVWVCVGSARLLAPRAASWVGLAIAVVVLASEAGGALMAGVNVEFVPLAALPLLYRWAARGRWVSFGVLLGATFAVKPILLALLLLPLLARSWRALCWAVVVPVALSGAALTLMPGPSSLLGPVLAHLAGGSQPAFEPADASLAGVLRSFGVAGATVLAARGAVFALGLGAAVLRWRQGGDPVARVVEAGTLAVLTSIVTASLAWDHYALFTVPLLVLVSSPSSLLRRAWLVWPCLLPLVAVVFPLPARVMGPFDYGSRAGLALLAVLLVLSATVLHGPRDAGSTAELAPAPEPSLG